MIRYETRKRYTACVPVGDLQFRFSQTRCGCKKIIKVKVLGYGEDMACDYDFKISDLKHNFEKRVLHIHPECDCVPFENTTFTHRMYVECLYESAPSCVLKKHNDLLSIDYTEDNEWVTDGHITIN